MPRVPDNYFEVIASRPESAFNEILDGVIVREEAGREFEVDFRGRRLDREIIFGISIHPDKRYVLKVLAEWLKTGEIRSVPVVEPDASRRYEKAIYPIPIPPGAKWEDITIKFIDGHNVEIKCRDMTSLKSDYKKMGFEDSRSLRPNSQWKLLQCLAATGGSVAHQDRPENEEEWKRAKERLRGYGEEVLRIIGRKPDEIKHQKQKLSKCLKKVFQLQDDPFHSYRRRKRYEIKLTLIPES